MRRLITAEIERTLGRKSTKILFITIIFLPVIIDWLAGYQLRHGAPNKDIIDCLNYSIYHVDEFNILLVSIIGPLFFNECLSLEIDSGAYKLVVTRPFKKWKFIVSKWISSGLLYLCMIFSVLLIKTILGFICMPKVQYTTYFNISGKFDLFNALFYNIKYYLIIFIIHMIILGITSFVSVNVKKPILTFMATSVVMMGSIYFSEAAKSILLNISLYVSSILSGSYNLNTVFAIIAIDFMLFGVSLYIWDKNIGINV